MRILPVVAAGGFGFAASLAVAGMLVNADESTDLLSGAGISQPTATASPEEEPPNPWISDSGVKTSIDRDFVPIDPDAPPPPAEWSSVVCEADAQVFLDSAGRVTAVEEKGYLVTIAVGERVVTDADFDNLPYMSFAVHRQGDALVLGYRICWNAEGEELPMPTPLGSY
jgi:hypothetical protein